MARARPEHRTAGRGVHHARAYLPELFELDVGFGHALGMVTRSPEERKADALARLTAVNANVWVASASPTGAVHLVPVSHTWNGSRIVLATEPASRTVANLTGNPRVRLALGDTRDVVVIDAVLAETVPESEAPVALADGYAAQAGWDPRTDSDDYVYLVFGPERIQVWREAEDLAGRTVMRDGVWVA
jgi:Pyridoxamine 5'-phosphate oxidase